MTGPRKPSQTKKPKKSTGEKPATKKKTVKKTAKKTAAQPEKKPRKKAPSRGGARPNSGGRREGSGRKPFEPTLLERKRVVELAGYGMNQDHIASLIRDGINKETLAKYFHTELVTGKALVNAEVGQLYINKIRSGDTAALIWWTKSQMGWSEKQRHEITGPDGEPIQFSRIERVIVDPKK